MTARCVLRPAVLRQIPLDRHTVIEASAGTGKTFTLEHLVVELVLGGRTSLDQVLIVTFTEKATSELRSRVRAKLEDLLAGKGPEPDEEQLRRGDYWTLDADAQDRLRRALRAFDGATIATIHAFCQRVLRENAFASGRLFEEQQVDGRDAFARAMREALRRRVAPDPARARWLQVARRAGWSIGEIEELLWKCVQQRGELRPSFDPVALEGELRAFDGAQVRRLDARAALKGCGLHGNTVGAIGDRLNQLADAIDRAQEEGDRDGLGAAPVFVLLAHKLKEDLPEYFGRVSAASVRGPIADACAAAIAILRVTPPLPAALAQTILAPVREELARGKRQAGQYDFDDMLSLVDGALRGPRAEALVAAMRERWRCVLVDEFQDTDEVQWSIFRRAFFEPHAARRSTVYLVGDPKQSIYRFRGADVDTYARARSEIVSSGGERVGLERNFRATQALVDATNAIFAPAAGEPYFTSNVVDAPRVSCGRPEQTLVDGTGHAVTPLHVAHFARGSIPLAELAALAAREIHAITDPSHPWRLNGEPLRHEHIFLLTRTHAEERTVGQALRAEGVPFSFYKEDGLFQTDEAKEVRALLLAIADPADRARRAGAWLTPFFGLSVEDIERAGDLAASHPYVARLRSWRALAEERDFLRLFESVVRDSGVVRRQIFFSDGERKLTNYLHVLELLLEHANRTRATLSDLVHALTGLIDQTRYLLDLEGNVQRLESDRRAVQIMTIHKSKGLEAPVVFILGGFGPPGGRGEEVSVYHEEGRRVVWPGRSRGEAKSKIKEEEQEEQQRLMYVALTRAQGRLYLPCASKDGAPTALRGPYQAVHARLWSLLREPSAEAWLTVEDVSTDVAPPQKDACSPGAAPWQPPPALLDARHDAHGDEARLRARHAGTLVTSYTRMKGARGGIGSGVASAWTDSTEERRLEKAADVVDDTPLAPLRATRTSGVFVHEVLERVPIESFAAPTREAWRDRADIAALFDETMAVHRVEPSQRDHAERLVWSAYTSRLPLPDGAGAMTRLADAAHVLREMEFVFPAASKASVLVRGSLDVVFEHSGRAYFADWKTDALASYEPPALARHVRAHYTVQLRLYSLAIVKWLGVTTGGEYDDRFGGLLYGFLRGLDSQGRGVFSERPTWEEIAVWERELGEQGERRSQDPRDRSPRRTS